MFKKLELSGGDLSIQHRASTTNLKIDNQALSRDPAEVHHMPHPDSRNWIIKLWTVKIKLQGGKIAALLM